MAQYTLTGNAAAPPFLHLPHEGRLYRPVIQHCETGSSSSNRRGARYRPHTHPVYHMVLYTLGHGRFVLGGEACPFQRGTLALVPPEMPHDFLSRRPGAWAYNEVTFVLQDDGGALSRMDFSQLLQSFTGLESLQVPVRLHLAEEQTRTMEAAFEQLLDFMQARGRLSIFYGTLTLAQLFTQVLQECQGANSALPSPLERARQMLEIRYAETIRVNELAAQANLSRAHFLRRFKKAFGVSPIAYQHRLRVRAARVLLKTTELSCQQIAERSGYCDAYHFSKMYRKITGHPPTNERKSTGATRTDTAAHSRGSHPSES